MNKKLILLILGILLLGLIHYALTDVINEGVNYHLIKDRLALKNDKIVSENGSNYSDFSIDDYLKLKESTDKKFSYSVLINTHEIEGINSVVFVDDEEFRFMFQNNINDNYAYVSDEVYKKSEKLINFKDFYIKDRDLNVGKEKLELQKFPSNEDLLFNFTISSIIEPSRFQTIDYNSIDVPLVNQAIIVPLDKISLFKDIILNSKFVKSKVEAYEDADEILSKMKEIRADVNFVKGNSILETKDSFINSVEKNWYKILIAAIFWGGLSFINKGVKPLFIVIELIVGIILSIAYRGIIQKELYLIWLNAQAIVIFVMIVLAAIRMIIYKSYKKHIFH